MGTWGHGGFQVLASVNYTDENAPTNSLAMAYHPELYNFGATSSRDARKSRIAPNWGNRCKSVLTFCQADCAVCMVSCQGSSSPMRTQPTIDRTSLYRIESPQLCESEGQHLYTIQNGWGHHDIGKLEPQLDEETFVGLEFVPCHVATMVQFFVSRRA